MAHTKGPWTVNGPYHIQANTHTGDGIPVVIAKVVPMRNGDTKERDANAQLLACAPELLEALQKASVLLSTYGSGDTKHTDSVTGDPLTPVMRQIMSAIEKATK